MMKLLTVSALAGAGMIWASAALAQPAGVALPETVPMPLARPAEAPAREPEPQKPRGPQRVEITKDQAEAAAKLCNAFMARDIAVAESAEAVLWDNGCGAPGQARMSAIKLKDGKRIELRPSALIRCETAEAVADWVRDELAPAVEPYGGIARIEVAASYHCRPRNNIKGALMSEHGRANAMDVRAVVLGDGRRFGVDLPETPIALLGEMRRGACARFTTVLGPGSDGFHENHFHLDLAQRRGGYRLCQWNLPIPPEPPRRPDREQSPEVSRPTAP